MARAELRRYPSDEAELARIRASHPDAADRIEQGERLALAGDTTGALAAFQRASDDEPSSALVWRRRCEAAIVLGDARQAVTACRQAQQSHVSPLNVRSLVRAITVKAAPRLDANEVAVGLAWAGEERKHRPDEPWGYASICEIADRIGDEVMLERCTSDLERIAPTHEATARARAALARSRPAPWAAWAGWLLLAGAGLGTAVHAASRRVGLRAARRSLAATSAGAFLIGSFAAASPARADEPPADPAAVAPPEQQGHVSDWAIDEADPLKSVPTEARRNENPLQFGYWLMDLVARATAASKRGDHSAAIKYYAALAKAVPDRATAFEKLCEEHEALGQRDDAVRACGLALFVEGSTLGDYDHYARLVLAKNGNLSAQEVTALGDVLSHLRDAAKTSEAAAAMGDKLECQVAHRTGDVAELKECTAGMARRAPESPETRWYQWSLAFHQGRYDEANRMLADAKARGIDFKGAEQMQEVTSDAVNRRHRNVFLLLGGLLIAAVATVAAAMGLWRRSARRPADGVDLGAAAGASGNA
jgi:tetratricopeptide (TPR) repeat protein